MRSGSRSNGIDPIGTDRAPIARQGMLYGYFTFIRTFFRVHGLPIP